MKTKLIDKTGKEKGFVDLPKNFAVRIREDILSKVFEAQRGIYAQAYGSMEGAGAQYSASGISKKKRHDWKATYGKGISRVPRKIMSRHGSSFNWIGATISSTRGGRRPHAPRSAKNPFSKINKKELLIAFNSALAGTAAMPRGVGVRGVGVSGTGATKNVVVFEDKVLELKTKDFKKVMEKVFPPRDDSSKDYSGEHSGKPGYAKVWKVKSIRAGRGKMRGRKYKSNAGLLFVLGNAEKMKRKGISVINVKDLTVRDLTLNGEPGRLVCYSENAIKEIGERFK